MESERQFSEALDRHGELAVRGKLPLVVAYTVPASYPDHFGVTRVLVLRLRRHGVTGVVALRLGRCEVIGAVASYYVDRELTYDRIR